MGKQTNIKLRGTVDNIIYYQWKGIHCIRTVPARVRQNANTKKAASLFGVAVKSASVVRALLKPVLPGTTDRAVIYALDSAFRKWLHTNPLDYTEAAEGLPEFKDFTFNKEAAPGKLYRVVMLSRANDSDLLIKLPGLNPARDLTAPRGTRHLGIQFMAAVVTVDMPGGAKCIEASISLPYDDVTVPAQEILLTDVTGLECLVLVVMAVRYYKSGDETMPVNQVRWKPTAIVGSFYN